MAKSTRITRRIIDSKKHTQGFILQGGRRVSRSEAVTMASSGKISGVRIVNGPHGSYLQSVGTRGLYDLPVEQMEVTSSNSRSSSLTKASRSRRAR